MMSVGEQLEKMGLQVKVVCLTDDEDPDSYILKYGEEKFRMLIDDAISFSDFKLSYLKKGINFNSDLELSQYVDTVIREASNINDEIRREIILKKLAKDTNLSYNTLEKRLEDYLADKKKVKTEIVMPKVKTVKLSKYDKASYGMIYAMLLDKKYLDAFKKQSLYFTPQLTRYLLTEIEYYYKKYGNITIADFYTYLLDKEDILGLYNNIINYADNDIVSDEAVNDYMKVIKDYNEGLEIKRLRELMMKTSDELEKSKIAEEIKLLRIGE